MPRRFISQSAAALIGLGLTWAPAMVAQAADVQEHITPEDEQGLFATEPFPYIFNLVMFLILFAVLAKFVWPVILQGLQAREAKQRDDLQSAQNAATEAQATLEKYKQQLAEAQKQSQAILEQSRTEATRLATELKAQAQTDITAMKDRAAADITATKEQAIGQIYEQTAELATQVAGKILGRELTAADQSALVNASLKELTDLNHN